jgi:hypothetical protein
VEDEVEVNVPFTDGEVFEYVTIIVPVHPDMTCGELATEISDAIAAFETNQGDSRDRLFGMEPAVNQFGEYLYEYELSADHPLLSCEG